MEIGFISRELPPDTGWGGIGTYTLEMARALVTRGHRVRIVSLATDEPNCREIGGVEIYRVRPSDPGKNFPLAWRLRRHHGWFVMAFATAAASKIRELHKSRHFDLVEAAEFNADGFGLLWGSTPFPVVTRLHTPRELIDLVSGSRLEKHRLSYALERVCITRAAGLTAPSRAIREETEQALRVSIPNLAAIPNPIDPTPFSVARSMTKEPFSLLYVGRLEHRKGLTALAEAVPRMLQCLPQLQIHFVGNDGEKEPGLTWSEYIRCTVPLARQKNLHFYKVPRTELPQVMAKAELAVFPSIWENFPYVLLECFAAGTPALASANGGMKEIVENGVSGWLLSRNDADEIVSAVTHAFSDRPRLLQMGSSAVVRLNACFSAEAVAPAMERYYAALVSAWKKRGEI